jgi:hypothetical protein
MIARIRAAAFAGALLVVLPCDAQLTGPFQVKSGIVESTMDGLGAQTMVLYFDDYGAKQATYTTSIVDLGTGKIVSHTLHISLANGTVYVINLDEKTGFKTTIPLPLTLALAVGMTPELKSLLKVTNLPDRVFLGKTCSGIEANAMGVPAKAWAWKGLTLYMEASAGGKTIVMKATKLTPDVPVSADKFKVPIGIRIAQLRQIQ